jgi:hypothetical protein
LVKIEIIRGCFLEISKAHKVWHGKSDGPASNLKPFLLNCESWDKIFLKFELYNLCFAVEFEAIPAIPEPTIIAIQV